MKTLPKGTVTLLFTDIVGSTKLWTMHPHSMQVAQEQHDRLMRNVLDGHHGYVFKTVGDQFCAAFEDPLDGLAAAIEAQEVLQAETWPEDLGRIIVRMGLHTGTVQLREGDYFGLALSRIARLHSAAHGGQIILSRAAADLIRTNLPQGVSLLDLGEHRFKDLQNTEQVFQVIAPGLTAEFPPLKTLIGTPNNLPQRLSPFIGRESELQDIKRFLSRVRLLTLTGPGGTGKTRLSLQAAAELLDYFPDGVYFVSLAAVTDPAHVPPALAQELGVTAKPKEELTDALCRSIGGKKMLLVLDNFEQVVEAAADIAQLLERTARLNVIVSSRETLCIRGEQEYPVPPLEVPAAEAVTPETLSATEAAALFIQHASMADPGFTVTGANAAAIGEICRTLEGLPLAIELAASRLKVLSPARLSERLSDRFKLLSSDRRDIPERQRTIRNTIDWSYQLLTPDEQTLFALLGVFRGSFTLEAAEKVCGPGGSSDVLDGIESLLAKSLLRRAGNDTETPRFDMLGTIRGYAEEKLQSSPEHRDVRDRHGIFYAEMAESYAHAYIRGPWDGPSRARKIHELDEGLEDIRSALKWSITGGNIITGLRIAARLPPYLIDKNSTLIREEFEWITRLLSSAGDSPEPSLKGRALNAAGSMAFRLGHLEEAETFFQDAIRIARETGDTMLEANALLFLAPTVAGKPDRKLDTAENILRKARELFREMNNPLGTIRATIHLGETFRMQGKYREAHEEYETIVIKPEVDYVDDNLIRVNFGFIKKNLGLPDEAVVLFREVLSQEEKPFMNISSWDKVCAMLGIAATCKAPEKAARLTGALQHILEDELLFFEPAEQAEYDTLKANLINRLDEERFTRLEQEGRAMSMEGAIEYALKD